MSDYTLMRAGDAPDYTGDAPGATLRFPSDARYARASPRLYRISTRPPLASAFGPIVKVPDGQRHQRGDNAADIIGPAEPGAYQPLQQQDDARRYAEHQQGDDGAPAHPPPSYRAAGGDSD